MPINTELGLRHKYVCVFKGFGLIKLTTLTLQTQQQLNSVWNCYLFTFLQVKCSAFELRFVNGSNPEIGGISSQLEAKIKIH